VSDFLGEMVRSSRLRADIARERMPRARPQGEGPPTRMRAALAAPAAAAREVGRPGPLAIIAEIKRRSPSKGDIAPDLDAVDRALAYEAAGADAISVLTEPDRFGGSLEDLRAVAAHVGVPVLRKDFIVDPYQVWEAADAGAAAVLLIAAAVPGTSLEALLDECCACGLEALLEVHTARDLERACSAGATLIGVNNRDLSTLEVDLSTSEALGPRAGRSALFVSESGIRTPEDARRVRAAGAQAILVGEALARVRPDDLAAALAGLRGDEPPAEGLR
jgi:indole-3-glycerol phosphate synthase